MPFATWAIVEIMGRQQLAGYVTEEAIAGVNMLRVDVPEIEGNVKYTRYLSNASIYSITPVDEVVGRRAAESFAVPQVSPYLLRLPSSTLLAEKVSSYGGDDFDEDDDDDDGPGDGLFSNIDWARNAMNGARDNDGPPADGVGF